MLYISEQDVKRGNSCEGCCAQQLIQPIAGRLRAALCMIVYIRHDYCITVQKIEEKFFFCRKSWNTHTPLSSRNMHTQTPVHSPIPPDGAYTVTVGHLIGYAAPQNRKKKKKKFSYSSYKNI